MTTRTTERRRLADVGAKAPASIAVKLARSIRPAFSKHSRELRASLPALPQCFAFLVAGTFAAIASTTPLRESFSASGVENAKAVLKLREAARGLSSREVEGRLSGGFDHRPFRAGASEAAEADLLATLRVSGATAAIQDAMSERRASLSHALGIGHLLLGDGQRAILELQRALAGDTGMADLSDAIRRSRNGPLLNDLSVALSNRGQPADLRLALEAADRARILWKGPETAWNYALAVAGVNMDEPALRAWREYQNHHETSGWHAESVRHVARLTRRSAASSWAGHRPRLEAAFVNGDVAGMRAVLVAFPQQTREWIEETALPSWAGSLLANEAIAGQKFRAIALLAREIERISGDRLLLDHTDALQRTARRPQLLAEAARAHLAFQRGRALYDRSEVLEALKETQRSLLAFHRQSLPFRHVSALTAASCQYIQRDYTGTRTLAASILNAADSRQYPSLGGRAHWLLGLVAVETGDPRQAIAHYRQSVDRFTRTGELHNRAGVTSLLAQAQDGVGLTDDSWRGRFDAFALYPHIQTVRGRHAILIESAMAAVRSRDFALARLLLDRDVSVNLEARDPLGLSATLRLRSMLHHLLSEDQSAEADLASARKVASSLRDPVTRASFMTRLETTAALQMLRRDPVRAQRILSPVQSSHGTLADVAEMSLALSDAFSNDPASAVRRLLNTIDVLEARLTNDDGELWRSPLVAQPLISLYDEAITLLLTSGRPAEALQLSERARLSVRRLNGVATTAAHGDWILPSDSAAIVFYVAGADVVSWSIRRGRVHPMRHAGAAAQVRSMARESASSLGTPRGEEASRFLSAMLIAPHWDMVSSADRLLLVPDDALWIVPFAALRGPHNHYLADDFVIELAGSLRDSMRCRHRAFGKPRTALLVGAEQPLVATLAALPEVRGEITQVQRSLRAAGVTVMERSFAGLPEAAANADIVHFAGHAVRNANEPGLSHLALNAGARLYARDIRRWRLRDGAVVVLSACEGAVRDGKHLDAWGSIADAFAHAGAGGVIGATTPVDDREASAFATAYYKELTTSDPAAALNRVQRSRTRDGNPAPSWPTYVYIIGNCS